MRIILILFTLMIEVVVLESMSYGYNEHSRIEIYGNAQLTKANGITGGDGTKANPYIIEGWKIAPQIGTESGWIRAAVMIYNTTAYFIIRNCLIDCSKMKYGYGRGLELQNLSNGIIENCVVQYYGEREGSDIADRGINIADCKDTTVIGNKITNFGIGIALNGTNILISKNIVSDSKKDGIIPSSISRNITITYNQVSNSVDDGIEMFGDVQDVYIAYNKVNNMRDACIATGNTAGGTRTKKITVEYNEVSGSRAKPEIHICDTEDSVIRYNNIKGPQGIEVTANAFRCRIQYNNILGPGFDDSDGSNSWNGNYWVNWTSPDNNNNGIVDKPYLIPRHQNSMKIYDDNPLVNPVEISSPDIPPDIDIPDALEVIVYPNPFKPNSNLEHTNIIFSVVKSDTKLPKNTIIRIYTIAGELVKMFKVENDVDQVCWDAKDDAGNELSSGIYIYYITTPISNKKYNGKLAIVR